jgi:site-specific DNA recombinase
VVGYYLDEDCRSRIPIQKRHEGGRLLEDAAAGLFDLIVVYTVDRWSRYRRVFYEGLDRLTELGLGFASATQTFETVTPGGRAMLSMLTTFAELDRDMIEEKLTGGREKWARTTFRGEDGTQYNYWTGGRVPWGYRLVEMHHRTTLALSESVLSDCGVSQVEVVRWCYDWAVTERLTCAKIAARLNSRSVPRYSHIQDGERGHLREATTPNYWTEQNVAQLLRRTIYKGEHLFGLQSKKERELIPLRYPAIVSAGLWEAAQEALVARRTWSDRNSKHLYLLRGLIRCGHCGAGFIATARYGGGKEVPGRWHYLCQTKHRMRRVRRERDGITCIAKPIRESVETLVWSDILDFIHHPSAAIEQLRGQMQRQASRGDEIRAEMCSEERSLDEKRLAEKRLVKLYTEDRVSDEQYDERSQEIETEKAAISGRIAVLKQLLAAAQQIESRLETSSEWLERMRGEADQVEEWTWERKRALIELWVNAVIVGPPTSPGEQPTIRVRYLFEDPQNAAANDTRPSTPTSPAATTRASSPSGSRS